MTIFKDTKMLISQVDEYLDAISQGAEIFRLGIKNYLEKDIKSLEGHCETIGELERKADDLRRNIETHLYGYSLIPENRGDVLGLLESLDNVIDEEKKTLNQFFIENPLIPEEFNKGFDELAGFSVMTCEALVLASRAFFRDVGGAKDHLHKVHLYEKEADKAAGALSRRIFEFDLDLSHKAHLRYFAHHIDNLADIAEEVADRLAIIVIKRTL